MLDNNPQGLQTVPGNKCLTKREIQVLGGCYSVMETKGAERSRLPPILTREQRRYSKTSACQR